MGCSKSVLSLIGFLSVFLAGTTQGQAEDPKGVAPLECKVFKAPQLHQKRMQALLPLIPVFRRQDYQKAETMLVGLSEKFPDWADIDYNIAASQTRQGKTEDALSNLGKAVDKGFFKLALMQNDADFAALKSNHRYTLLLAGVRANASQLGKSTTPAEVAGGTAFVAEGNTFFNEQQGRLFSYFRFADKPEHLSVKGGKDELAKLLNGWLRAGTAAGNQGDLYDNRDRGHSRLNNKTWPQLSFIAYSKCASAANIDYGLNSHIFFNAITFGNSSTAVSSGPMWRSQARLAITTPKALIDTVLQAANNHLYVYPAVMDYGVKNGDMLPINSPYMLLSEGKSGSDRPLLEAISTVLAALQPGVKRALRSARLINPTVQMIFRRGMAGIETREDYLSAQAHPTAFDGKKIDPIKMAYLAHALKREEVPPVVRLRVEEESQPQANVEMFGPPNISETFITTPSAIGRIMRGTGGSKRLVVSAKDTKDPNKRPLTFHWSVLSGDKNRITIRPLTDDASRVEIIIPWHNRRGTEGAPDITTDRVDIGVFADNGAQLSAPAFVSLAFPPNQLRIYENGRIKKIEYNNEKRKKRPVDPLLFPLRDWSDEYHYSADGKLQGWTRHRKSSKTRFLADGRKVITADENGRPLEVESVRYQAVPISNARQEIKEISTGKIDTLSP